VLAVASSTRHSGLGTSTRCCADAINLTAQIGARYRRATGFDSSEAPFSFTLDGIGACRWRKSAGGGVVPYRQPWCGFRPTTKAANSEGNSNAAVARATGHANKTLARGAREHHQRPGFSTCLRASLGSADSALVITPVLARLVCAR